MDVPYLPPFPARTRTRATYAPPRARSLWDYAPASSWYLLLLGLVMTTGTVVLVEPAPVDLLIVAMLVAGLALGQLAFVPAHEAPLVLLAIFLSANVVSMISAIDMDAAVRYFGITAYLVASWVFFAGVLTRHGFRGARILMNGYVVAGMLSVVPGTLSYLHVIGYQDVFLKFGRPEGFFKDPNVFGPYMVPVLVWALVRLQSGARGLTRLWWLAAALLAGAGIFFSYSRACWINCVVSLAAYFFLQLASGGWNARKFFRMAGVMGVLAAFAVALGFLIIAFDPQLGHMLKLRLGSEGIQIYDQNQRFYTQHLALEAVRQNPLGLGPGQQEVTFTIATHSMYLRALVENGVLGFLSLYTMMALTVVRMLRLAIGTLDRRWRGLYIMAAACTTGMLVNGLVIDTLHWRHMWLLLALVWVSRPETRGPRAWNPSRERERVFAGGVRA